MSLIIYLIGAVDSLSTIFILFPIGLALIGLAWFFYLLEEEPENGFKSFFKYVKKSTVAALICLLFYVAIPNSKTIVAMYLIPKIVENKSIQKIPNKMLKIFDLKLDEWVKDLSPTKNKKR